jgi:hypothetical protein
MIPHSPIPLARLDDNELDEVRSLNAELSRVQKVLARATSDRDVINARVVIFLNKLKRRYHLETVAAVIDGEYLYEIEMENFL